MKRENIMLGIGISFLTFGISLLILTLSGNTINNFYIFILGTLTSAIGMSFIFIISPKDGT